MNANKLLVLISISTAISMPAFGQLEEIIVTATKRVESLQDVPLSVSVMSEERMLTMDIKDMKDLSDFVPNFHMAESTMMSNLYIRGLGSGLSHSTEQSVGMFVDGVYIGRAAANNMGFLDVSMVEVLRGPQGTLFGKNTVAGALIVRTNDPTDEFEGRVTGSYGGYSTVGNHYDLGGYVSGPVSESVSYRLTGKYESHDGYVENLGNGPDGANREDIGFRGKLRWDASENTVVDLRVDYFDYETEGQVAAELFDVIPPILNAYEGVDPNFSSTKDWKASYNCDLAVNNRFCPQRDQEMQTYAMTINHEFATSTLTSITAYQDYQYDDDFYAADFGLVGSFTANRVEEFKSFSQEVRLTSESSDTFDYIIGGYFESSEINRNASTPIHFPSLKAVLGPTIPSLPALARSEDWGQETDSFAAFGQLRWHVSDKVSMLFGARYSYEEKSFEFDRYYTAYDSSTIMDVSRFPPGAQAGLFGKLGPLITRSDSASNRDENKLTGSFTVQYQPTDQHMMYYTASQGHKTGGFDDRVISLSDIGFDEETSLMHEIGAKTSWLDGRMNFNIAAFHIAFEDLQVSSFQPDAFAFLTSNAGEASSKGIEADLMFQVTDTWTLGGSLGLLDAKYDRFNTAPCTRDQSDGNTAGCVGGVQDLGGQVLQFAPDYKGNVYSQFTTVFDSGWLLNARVEANFSGSYFTDLDLDPHFQQESYLKWNASIQMTSLDDRYEISLIGRNLSNEKVASFGVDTPLVPTYFAALTPPRDITLRLGYRF